VDDVLTTGPPGQRRPGELPVEVTAFVGRDAELTVLAGLLGSARLVTLTGPGGVGKTRVALRAAGSMAGRFTHGVCLVELSGLRDPELLPNAVAGCLRLPETDARSQLDATLDHLRERELLLILDTCEHLLDACAMLADVLLRCTTAVTVLATSRQPLDVPGEHMCPVPPLAPDDAVTLFGLRAAAAVPGFTVTDANRPDVLRLCHRLDGIPLAIELATVRLRALPLDQLAGRLDERLRLLTGEHRPGPPHHQTLRAATQWSHDLCTPAERLLWARLSVFTDSFSAEAAEQVCSGGALAPPDVLETLIGLVDKSVVLRVDEGGTRYRQLDSIREFGAERLSASGEEPTLRDRHIDCFLGRAANFGTHLAGSRQADRFRELRRDHGNLRTALDYALTVPGRDRDAARLATSLSAYWQMSGLLAEGRYWLRRVLDRFTEPSAERAWALIVDGSLASWMGEVDDAILSLGEGIPMASALGDDAACTRGYLYLNQALTFAGRHAEAGQAGAEAEHRAQAAGDVYTLATLDAQMAYLDLLAGRLAAGIERARRGLARFEPGNDERWSQSYLHSLLGLAYFLLGDYPASTESSFRTLSMKHELGDGMGTAYALEGIAWIAAKQSRYVRAAWLLGAAGPLWDQVGKRLGGNAIMQALRAEAEAACQQALGTDRYPALFREGARAPLDRIVALALADADELTLAALGGEPAAGPLTSRENEIAALVADGLSNREIAARLVISKRTVDAHIEHIFSKLGVSSRIQLVNWLNSSGALCGLIAGGRVTDSSGGVPWYRSISTRVNCPAHPWLSVEEGTSAVSTLGFPCRQNVGSAGSGSYQAPVDNCATPGRTASSTASPARQAPRSLKIRTRSPSFSPRAEASPGFIRTGSRPAILTDWLCAPTSSWLCSRDFGWLATSCRLNRPARADPSHSSGSSQTGCPGQSGYWYPSIVAEKISIFPVGVVSGCFSGSARKSANATCCSLTTGSSSPSPAQNSSNPGTGSSASESLHSSYRCRSHSIAVRPSVNSLPVPSRSARSEKIA
jgi:predicted ATPase/DNA-binding NarL/FixJ family response regulator